MVSIGAICGGDGDISECINYRGFRVFRVQGKVYCWITIGRVVDCTEDEKCGFRKGRGYMD